MPNKNTHDQLRVFVSALENNGARFYSYNEKTYLFEKLKELTRTPPPTNAEALEGNVNQMIDFLEQVSCHYYESPCFDGDGTRYVVHVKGWCNTIRKTVNQHTAPPVEVDVEGLVHEFCERHDDGGYPFEGEEYDINLMTFFTEWLTHSYHLTPKDGENDERG